MRTQQTAHWEIRTVMCNLLTILQKIVPAVFDDFVFVGEDKNGVPYYSKDKN